jgi:hypothetical protein
MPDLELPRHPQQGHRRRRAATTAGGIVGLTVLGLCGSALPASGLAVTATSAPLSGSPVASVATVATTAESGAGDTTVTTLEVPALQSRTVGKAPSATATTSGVVAELQRTGTADYAMVGVTWEAGSAAPGTRVLVASREDGQWSDYEPLDVEPEPEDAAGTDARGGTEPMWVGRADGIAVRVVSSTGEAPADLKVATVEPDREASAKTTPTASTAATATTAARKPAPGAPITGPVDFPVMPDIMTRKQWGADESLGDACWAPRYGRSARAVVVHHTVNANDYDRNDGPAIMRSILAYHTQGQGWCDIGYNLLVDRYGRIYEGRAGGIRLPVRGAHAGDYNTDTVGISMIGDYDKARLTRRLKNAMVRLVGWRLGTSYTPISGRTNIYDKRVPHILGHRDVMSTACPGRYGYAFLPELRKRVRRYLSDYHSPIEARAERLGRDVTGNVFIGEAWRKGGFMTRFNRGQMLLKPGLGPHWLSGRALKAYQRAGSVGGPLGYPKSDVQATDLAGVRRALFEHGGIYLVGKRASALYGRVFFRWARLGAVNSSLGAPISSIVSTGTRETARFQHGRITWDKAANQMTVEKQ